LGVTRRRCVKCGRGSSAKRFNASPFCKSGSTPGWIIRRIFAVVVFAVGGFARSSRLRCKLS
jgi:hypothetical protein